MMHGLTRFVKRENVLSRIAVAPSHKHAKQHRKHFCPKQFLKSRSNENRQHRFVSAQRRSGHLIASRHVRILSIRRQWGAFDARPAGDSLAAALYLAECLRRPVHYP